MIGCLFEASLLMLWWVSGSRTRRRHNRVSSALQREIAALHHALSEMVMEKHGGQEQPRRRDAP